MKILDHYRIRSEDCQFVHLAELTNALRNARDDVVFVDPMGIDKEQLGAEVRDRLRR